MMQRTLVPTLVPADDLEQKATEEAFLDDEVQAQAQVQATRSRRRWYAAGAVSVALALGVVVVRTVKPTEAPQPAQASTQYSTELVQATCASPGANCLASGCCNVGGKTGYQCYKKNDNWGECMESCEAGVHPGEKEGTYGPDGKFIPAEWSCDKLGNRSAPDPCSAPGEDCRNTRCCSADRGGSGMTCFEKNFDWASCQETCEPGDWSCRALGERTPFKAGCGWAGKSCAADRLCCNLGFVCAVKDATWTACTQTKKKTTWMTENIPIPADWEGTVVGGGRGEYSIQPAAKGAKVAGTSLYCFMAFLPDSYEVGLHDVAKQNKASVFACDEHDSFHSWQSAKAGWDTGEATLSNTDVFIDVWNHMIESGKYLKTEWTVKVDADAVLIADRLKGHLAALRPPYGMPMYIKNNGMDPGMGNNGFLGAIEVFSRQAVQIYADNKDGCHESLGIQAGEDGFFKGCMDALGVGFMTDPELFNPDRSAGACHLGQRAGFHPLKTVNDWKCCLDITNGIDHKVEYGVCTM